MLDWVALASRASAFRGVMVSLVVGAAAASAGCGDATGEPRRAPIVDGGAGAADEEGGAPSAGGDRFGADAATGGVALGGAGSAGGSQVDGGASGGPGAPTPAPRLSLRAITVFQTHELPLMRAGTTIAAPARPAPLVAGKPALVRVYVDVEPSFVGRPLLGVLDLKTPQVTRTLVSERTISQS